MGPASRGFAHGSGARSRWRRGRAARTRAATRRRRRLPERRSQRRASRGRRRSSHSCRSSIVGDAPLHRLDEDRRPSVVAAGDPCGVDDGAGGRRQAQRAPGDDAFVMDLGAPRLREPARPAAWGAGTSEVHPVAWVGRGHAVQAGGRCTRERRPGACPQQGGDLSLPHGVAAPGRRRTPGGGSPARPARRSSGPRVRDAVLEELGAGHDPVLAGQQVEQSGENSGMSVGWPRPRRGNGLGQPVDGAHGQRRCGRRQPRGPRRTDGLSRSRPLRHALT